MTSRDSERSSGDPNTLRAKYLENSWRCYLATIANYQIVCCEAVRSAILATAWPQRLISHRGIVYMAMTASVKNHRQVNRTSTTLFITP